MWSDVYSEHIRLIIIQIAVKCCSLDDELLPIILWSFVLYCIIQQRTLTRNDMVCNIAE